MFEELLKKMMSAIEPMVKEWLKEAYDCGYKIGSEDATRRMHEMYIYGRISGYTDAKECEIEIPEVDEELAQDVFEGVES